MAYLMSTLAILLKLVPQALTDNSFGFCERTPNSQPNSGYPTASQPEDTQQPTKQWIPNRQPNRTPNSQPNRGHPTTNQIGASLPASGMAGHAHGNHLMFYRTPLTFKATKL